MATRTIESPKDRLVTILVAPLMSCAARLPVYTVLIGACIPAGARVLGFLPLPGLTLLAMYLLGIVVALLMAWLFKKTILKGETPMLIMELPPYKRPLVRIVLRHMWDRSKLFLRRAGTVILGINILLWFLATYPKSAARDQLYEHQRTEAARQVFTELATDHAAVEKIASLKPQFERYAEMEDQLKQLDPAKDAKRITELQTNLPPAAPNYRLYQQLDGIGKDEAGAKLRGSFAGAMGRAVAPIIAPLGFDWKMGIGIISSFAAREVFVSTMSTVYSLGRGEDTKEITPKLSKTMSEQKRADGTAVYTTLTAVTLMVFYVFALQMREHGGGGAARDEFVEVAAIPVGLHGRAGVGAGVHHVSGRTIAGVALSICRFPSFSFSSSSSV